MESVRDWFNFVANMPVIIVKRSIYDKAQWAERTRRHRKQRYCKHNRK